MKPPSPHASDRIVDRHGKPALKPAPDTRRMDAAFPNPKNPDRPRPACTVACECSCDGRGYLTPEVAVHKPNELCPSRTAEYEWWFPEDWETNDDAEEGDDEAELILNLVSDTTAAALAICETCPLRDACLTRAIESEPYGIWGGKTPSERAAIREGQGLPARLLDRGNTLLTTGEARQERDTAAKPKTRAERAARSEARQEREAAKAAGLPIPLRPTVSDRDTAGPSEDNSAFRNSADALFIL